MFGRLVYHQSVIFMTCLELFTNQVVCSKYMCQLVNYSFFSFNVLTDFAAKSSTNFKIPGLLTIPFVKARNYISVRSFKHFNLNSMCRSYKCMTYKCAGRTKLTKAPHLDG